MATDQTEQDDANAAVSAEFFDKFLADDEVCIVFEKITKVKKKENLRKNGKENVICKYFNRGVCKLRGKCKFLHICRNFIAGI
jgi:hypothetical protein